MEGEKYRLIRTGGQGLLGLIIKVAKKFALAENDFYPALQGMQYMHHMTDKRSIIAELDNDRYPEIRWTKVRDVLKSGV